MANCRRNQERLIKEIKKDMKGPKKEYKKDSPGNSVLKNPLPSAGDAGSIPGSRRSSEVGNAAHASILA